jgi:TrmH family RNA methyltransferase
MLTNADKKKIQSLQQKKFRDQYGEYLAEGFKVVNDAIIAKQEIIQLLVKGSVANDLRTKELMSAAARQSVPVDVIADLEFDKMSALDTPSGVIAVIKKMNDFIEINKPYIVLDAIKDPGNMGTIIRTAVWFGLTNIVIGKTSVDLYNPKVVQATMGSLFSINATENQDLPMFLETLKTQNYTVIATSLQGKDLPDLEVAPNKTAILIGNETTGLDPKILEFATHLYKINGSGLAESLNVSVAAGIVMFRFFGK